MEQEEIKDEQDYSVEFIEDDEEEELAIQNAEQEYSVQIEEVHESE